MDYLYEFDTFVEDRCVVEKITKCMDYLHELDTCVEDRCVVEKTGKSIEYLHEFDTFALDRCVVEPLQHLVSVTNSSKTSIRSAFWRVKKKTTFCLNFLYKQST